MKFFNNKIKLFSAKIDFFFTFTTKLTLNCFWNMFFIRSSSTISFDILNFKISSLTDSTKQKI